MLRLGLVGAVAELDQLAPGYSLFQHSSSILSLPLFHHLFPSTSFSSFLSFCSVVLCVPSVGSGSERYAIVVVAPNALWLLRASVFSECDVRRYELWVRVSDRKLLEQQQTLRDASRMPCDVKTGFDFGPVALWPNV